MSVIRGKTGITGGTGITGRTGISGRTTIPDEVAAGGGITPIDDLFTAGIVGDYWQPSNYNNLWTTSSQTTQVTADGQNVGYLQGLRTQGTSADLLQPTSSKRPMTVSQGGYQGIYGPGSTDHLETNAFTATSDPVIYGMQFYFSSTTPAHAQAFAGSRATPTRIAGVTSNSPYRKTAVYDNGALTEGSTTLAASTFYYMLVTMDSTERKIYIDGTLVDTLSADSGGDNTLAFYCGRDDSNVHCQYTIHTKGLVMYADPNTAGLVDSLNDWLSTYSTS